MTDQHQEETARAVREARRSVESGSPDTVVQISALALYLLARTVVRQQGEIESLLLDVGTKCGSNKADR